MTIPGTEAHPHVELAADAVDLTTTTLVLAGTPDPHVSGAVALALAPALLIAKRGSRSRQTVPAAVGKRADELRRGGASLHTIAAALNAEGGQCGGTRWSSTAVAKVLEAHAGTRHHVVNKAEPVAR